MLYSSDEKEKNGKNKKQGYLEFENKEITESARLILTSEFIKEILNNAQETKCLEQTLDPYSEEKKLFVRNLDPNVGEREIYNFFITYGQIIGIIKKYDYAFIEFANKQDALTALHKTDQKLLGTNRIRVLFAKYDRFAYKQTVNPLKTINMRNIEPVMQSTPSKRKFNDFEKDDHKRVKSDNSDKENKQKQIECNNVDDEFWD